MRVGFDSFAFRMQQNGGISRYFAELIPILDKSSIEPTFIEKLPKLWERRYPQLKELTSERATYFSRFWDSGTRFREIDIYHNTYYQEPIVFPKDLPMALTIHDFTPEKFPHLFPEGNPHLKKHELILKADLIFCVSKTTRDDLLTLYPKLKSKVFVTPLATSITSVSVDLDLQVPNSPYCMTVGRSEPYKDLSTAISAVKYLGTEKLVLFGHGQKEKTMNCSNSSGTIRTGGSDSVLRTYLQNATCLVYPSLSEGFGLPILEALSVGCPVVASELPVFRELFGDSILYAETQNPKSFVEQILRIKEKSLRDEQVSKGFEKAREYSWKKTATVTAEGYSSIQGN
jgi:glycosyltransferase involved in cell wall biosynthesis